jgi:hypothetical protein
MMRSLSWGLINQNICLENKNLLMMVQTVLYASTHPSYSTVGMKMVDMPFVSTSFVTNMNPISRFSRAGHFWVKLELFEQRHCICSYLPDALGLTIPYVIMVPQEAVVSY